VSFIERFIIAMRCCLYSHEIIPFCGFSFRVAYGGAQEYFGITPDVTTMGKVIGGGLPVGAYGGRRDIMEWVAPAGPMYQAGTLSGNPLAMTAGMETLKKLKKDGTYDELERKSKKLVDGIVEVAQKNGIPLCGDYAGGMFGWYFVEGPVKNFSQASEADGEKFGKWHRMMLERGVYLAPSMYEAGFMSLAHTDEDIEKTIAIADDVMSKL
jgi:glutamate-1-semialdehyde 2,1-aminomutase